MNLSWGWKSRLLVALNVVLMGVFALVVVVLVNVLGSRHYLRFDLTSSAEYGLSPQTLQVLGDLKKPVRMYACFYAYGRIDAKALEKLLNVLLSYEYHAPRGMVEVEQVDPHGDVVKVRALKEMLAIGEQGPGGIVNTVVVTCEDRVRVVSIDEMLRYDFTGYWDVGEPAGIKEISAERAVTNAIQDVLRAKDVPVGFLTGHGEGDIDNYGQISGFSGVALLLKGAGVEPRKIWIQGRYEIRDELKCIVILGPIYDFPLEEIGILRKYVESGGTLFVAFADEVEVKNLRGLVREFGVDTQRNVVFDEGAYLGNPILPLVTERYFRRHPITSRLIGTKLLFEDASSLALYGGRDLPYNVEPLFETTEDSFSRAIEGDRTEVGPFVLAAAVSAKPQEHDERGDQGRGRPLAVVVGDVDFAQNGCICPEGPVTFNPGNRLFLQSSFRWLLPEESSISIEPVPYEARTVEILPGQLRVVFWIVMIAMPATGIFAGIVMWFIRRK